MHQSVPIDIHPYVLRSRAPLNAKSVRREHHGVLIRVGGGYGCMHPWPELGDLPLDVQLDRLKLGEVTPNSRAAISCAQSDATARAEGRSLFDGLKVPRSHASLPMDRLAFESASSAGFDRVKVKMGKDIKKELEFISVMAQMYPRFRWRIDFNGTLKPEELPTVMGALKDVLGGQIDFLEDAVDGAQNDPGGAKNLIALAVDREVETQLEAYPFAILKPAVNELPRLLVRAQAASTRVVITSYMDHPLGQAYAAWQAALALEAFPDLIDTCGLITHGLFEQDAFTESLGPPRPDFRVPIGTGLGFDSLLESLSWKPLI